MFENVTLEISLKPFKKTDEAYVRGVCDGIFRQWHALLKNRKTVSVMLWVGDGSEILDYAGSLDEKLEWCHYLGTANLPYLEAGAPTETSLHERKQDYMRGYPDMTYSVLKMIVSTIKETAKAHFRGSVIRVGETFDIGPEFAISDFKYKRHPEICSGAVADRLGFVDATAILKSDTRRYAAYPFGIPEGTPFGRFFSKQANIFLSDMGFDYLWLSNGLGFSSNPWEKTGKIFDGEKYYPEKLSATKGRVFEFWRLFREECPDIPLETRGTNNSVGIDYASDGIPLYDLYTARLGITAPPNSPWAAINDNYGLEIMGHMTRICELPSEKFPFRYYLHDPWWINSPWYDRYDGSPCDIYLPMSISRINALGEPESANSLNILSIDNSFGNMPDACVNEPLPHLLKAEKDSPDEISPLVWVYPMREYTTASAEVQLREMNCGDNFICDAINDGLPLNTVTSTDNFLKHQKEIYKRSILLSPIPESPEIKEKLIEMSHCGYPVIIYGDGERLKELGMPSGVITVSTSSPPSALREALKEFGYFIDFTKINRDSKPPAISVVAKMNGLILSAYSADTTVKTSLRFPLGAPILAGCEAEICGGFASYHFARAEHRECRVFVEQSDGVISAREAAPVNAKYRRAIKLSGFRDATVRLFAESGCPCVVSTARLTDDTPEIDPRFTEVYDEKYGRYLEGRGINGSIYFLMGTKAK